jgi:flagellar basal body-associated protein FliL
MEDNLNEISSKKYFLEYLLPTIFLSLFFLASVIGCAVIAPTLIVLMSFISLLALGIVTIFILIMSNDRGTSRGTSTGSFDCFMIGYCTNECVNSDCEGSSGSSGNSDDVAGCCVMIGVFIIGIIILIGLALVLGGIIGALVLAGASLIALFSKEVTAAEKQRHGVLVPIAICSTAAFVIPLVFLGIYLKNGKLRDIGKLISEVPKLYKILFCILIAVSFILLIGWTLYCMNSREFRLGEVIATTFSNRDNSSRESSTHSTQQGTSYAESFPSRAERENHTCRDPYEETPPPPYDSAVAH